MLKNVITMVNENKFTLLSRGHEMTLIKNKWGWEMFTENAATRAYRTLGVKLFDSLEEVESHYKSWKGISQLVA